MRKPKIYIETTLFNHYFDKDRKTHADTVTLFKQIADGKYEAYTSRYVIEELEKALEPKRTQMLALIPKLGIRVLTADPEAESLAEIYVAAGILPVKYRTDGVHIALASIHAFDVIVSANFEHIVNPKTIRMTGVANIKTGCNPVHIASPKEFLQHENH